MRVDGNVAPVNGSSTETKVDPRAKLQAMLLKKALDSQMEQAAEVMRQSEGKGQIIDIRV